MRITCNECNRGCSYIDILSSLCLFFSHHHNKEEGRKYFPEHPLFNDDDGDDDGIEAKQPLEILDEEAAVGPCRTVHGNGDKEKQKPVTDVAPRNPRVLEGWLWQLIQSFYL